MNKSHQRSRQRIASIVADALKRRISAGEIVSGGHLPASRELAASFRTSLSTIGAALSQLRSEGWIEPGARRSMRVRCPLDRLDPPHLGIVHPQYDHSARGTTDVGAILTGICETLERLGFPYQDYPIYRHDVSVEGITERFGAVVCVETFRREDVLAELAKRSFPLVVANLEVPLNVSATRVDHIGVTRRAVRVLVELGHRRIAFIGRNPGHRFYDDALQGYEDGIADAQLRMRPEWIVRLEATKALPAYSGARRILEATPRPTAFVAGRDIMAEGICQAVTDHSLVVGEDVSVIGFDDYSWPEGQDLLTTFVEPCYDMGAEAAKLLASQLMSQSLEIQQRVIESRLILRCSVGRAPEDA